MLGNCSEALRTIDNEGNVALDFIGTYELKANTTDEQVKEYQRWVKNVYLPWIEQMATSFERKPVMVFTIPWYL